MFIASSLIMVDDSLFQMQGFGLPLLRLIALTKYVLLLLTRENITMNLFYLFKFKLRDHCSE